MNSGTLICFCAILGVSGNLALRLGMSGFAPHEGQSSLVGVLMRLLTTPLLWIGVLFYLGSMLGWLQVLSSRPLSQVYPAFVSLSFLLLLSASFLLLREPVRWTHFAGSGLILAGIWVSFQR
jgi:undecaprenyl phosphate-alpha-L-ara4N flippase subunit ArnE